MKQVDRHPNDFRLHFVNAREHISMQRVRVRCQRVRFACYLADLLANVVHCPGDATILPVVRT